METPVTDLIPEVINPIEDPNKKPRNTSFNLSLSNTTHRPSRKCPAIEDSMEIGGWSCSKCGSLLPHDDCLGVNESRWFRVMGYHCHVCENRWITEKWAKVEDKRGQKFTTMCKWELKRPDKKHELE
jgi:hypothetical protein